MARSCALSAGSTLRAAWRDRKANIVRQQLREFCYEAVAKRGVPRQEVVVETGFASVLAWVLSGWEGQQLARAVEATTLGQRFVVVALSVLSRGCALPVAWTVLRAGEKQVKSLVSCKQVRQRTRHSFGVEVRLGGLAYSHGVRLAQASSASCESVVVQTH